ncbi:MAG: hypothetical protein GXP35_16035 [Actinobacteria bacterium]|nr:hypothetical protein [Actinomycetota bacterium]
MAAPEYVPTSPTARPRSYRAPGVVPDAWSDDRGASVGAHQPSGPMLGHQGPDQGYAFVLARHLSDQLRLVGSESADDVLAGAVQIGLKRASIFGRAPVVHDLTIALRLWGFLDDAPPPQQVAERASRFDGVANPHHWSRMCALVACVPEATLRQSPAEVESKFRTNWRGQLDL